MLYDTYKQEQKYLIYAISDLDKRLDYIAEEQERFNSLNQGPDAEIINKWFDFMYELTVRHLAIDEAKGTAEEDKRSDDKNETDKIKRITLADFFYETSWYDDIMNILVKKEYCHSITHVWIDLGSGYKTLLTGIIKYLHCLKYLKRKPTNRELIEIARNTFHVEIGIDTVKKTNPRNLDLRFLPAAKTE